MLYGIGLSRPLGSKTAEGDIDTENRPVTEAGQAFSFKGHGNF